MAKKPASKPPAKKPGFPPWKPEMKGFGGAMTKKSPKAKGKKC